ncbi:MAG: hypothetical protein GXO50_06130, partial [Chlorobi bacterium]|nr:hypothetical protein [Chlorobiota bacterium]
EYIEIYDSVESYFNKIEKELSIKANKDKQEELKRKKLKKTNLWKMKKEWALPEDGKKNTVNFKIITSKQGKYSLSAKIKIYPDDLSKNPKMTITANYSDGTKDTKYEKITEKDGKFHNYEVYIKTNIHKKLNYISGKVLDHDKNSGTKHAHIKDISLKITNNNKIILK